MSRMAEWYRGRPGRSPHANREKTRVVSDFDHQSTHPPNAKVQQQGRLQGLHASKNRPAGPVCCNSWFGPTILNSCVPATKCGLRQRDQWPP
jgi:hypothetical protein